MANDNAYEITDPNERAGLIRRNVMTLHLQGTRAKRIAALLEIDLALVEEYIEREAPSSPVAE